ncbi:MAG TPA: esterase-like activity of phytase family protein [Gemmatimonadota bacterium]|nr:esterase-like activity of phytase family protein [Gemmatimonadota bacterium]
MRIPSGVVLALALATVVSACRSSEAAAQVEIVDVGRYNFTGGGSADPRLVAEELSGLSRVEGDRYVAVGDDHAALYFLDIAVDPLTGRVQSVSFASPVPLRDADGRVLSGPQRSDREDVAYDRENGTVWIADERDAGDPSRPSLVEVDPASGREIARIAPDGEGALTVYATIRRNYGFEALARIDDGKSMWTANEEALEIDGGQASPSEGSIVRLQEFDDELRPVRQLAYVTDPVGHAISNPPAAVGEDRSGVSALVALADGRLLVLERALAGDPSGMGGFRIRIYLADPSRATDVSESPFRSGLAGRTDWTPAAKTLLWERRFGLPVSNFEGMALGPRLSRGGRSLLLIADNGGGTWQSIYALELRGAR